MRTAPAERIIRNVANLASLRGDNLATREFRIIRDFVSDRLAAAWERDYWPDLTRCEKRYFRPLWASGTTYAAGDEVYYPQTSSYYQSLVGSNTGNEPADSNGDTDLQYWADVAASHEADEYSASTAYERGDKVYYGATDLVYQLHAATSTGNLPTDTDYWGVLAEFEKYVLNEQTGETAIGFVQGVFDLDPRKTTRAKEIAWMLTDDKITVLAPISEVWVQYRIRNPVLTGEVYSATEAYSSGDQVYFATGVDGNFYDANQSTSAGESPTSAAAKWDIVEIPLIFERFVQYGAFSDWLTHEGKSEKALVWDNFAMNEIAKQREVLVANQGQRSRPVVLTR